MMTVSKLSAGDGYGYYISKTVSGDEAREKGQGLTDYYTKSGCPQGRWMGRGTAALEVSGTVSEPQMKNLFGLGWHPNADAMIEAQAKAGVRPDAVSRDVKLGRAYAVYKSPSGDLGRALDAAIDRAEAVKGASLDPGERRAVRMQAAAGQYRKVMGENPPSGADLARWMNRQLKIGRSPVSGFDLTFSAPKSVSVLWAAGDDQTRANIERVHEQALSRALEWIEDNALYGRVGTAGTRVKVDGAVATAFRHWTSRAGDPDLHDHVVIANKVRRAGLDGSARATDGWVAVDGQVLYRNIQTASAIYNNAVVQGVRGLGYEMENRAEKPGNVQMEVAGVTRETIAQFSQRSAQIRQRLPELVAQFTERVGREPSTWELKELAQQATLETRQGKDPNQSLGELVARTRERLRQALPRPGGAPPQAHSSDDEAVAREEEPRIDTGKVAREIVAVLGAKRSTWADHHVQTQVQMWAARTPGVTAELVDEVAAKVRAEAVCLTPDSTAPQVIAQHGAVKLYASPETFAQEQLVIDAAGQEVVPSIMPADFEAARQEFTAPLDEGQIAVAEDFACSDRIVSAAIGPAGAGKTTALALAVKAAQKAGVNVVGLTTSAAAAEVLGAKTGARAETLQMWLAKREVGAAGEQWRLSPGDVVIVDEASMASTDHLARVVKDARDAGAFVRLVGDPNQLSAIGSGGLLGEIDRRFGAVRLEKLWRFGNVEEGLAGVELATSGKTDWYAANGRIHGVAPSKLAGQVMAQWFQQRADGDDVLVMARTNELVSRLAQEGQRLRVEAGEVDLKVSAPLRNGQAAGVGDQIITRQVDRDNVVKGHGFVRNGDRWTVTKVGRDGSLVVRDANGCAATLRPEYVRSSVQLGYASTVSVAQGATVEHGIVVADSAMSRNDLYVGLSRGTTSNNVWVGLDGRSAASVVQEIGRHSRTAETAHQMLEAEAKRVDDPVTHIPIMRDVFAQADRVRFDQRIREAYAQVMGPGREVEASSAADVLIGGQSRAALDNALRRGEAAGFSVQRLISAVAAEPVEGARDPARLVAWRIDRHVEASADRTGHARQESLAALSDDALAALREQVKTQRDEALQGLRQARSETWLQPREVELKGGGHAPAWVDRPHGHLTDRELSQATNDAMAAVSEATESLRQARQDSSRARGEWSVRFHQNRQDRHGLGPAAQAVATADHQESQARSADKQARAELAELWAEKRVRRELTGKSWYQETASREAADARQGDRGKAELDRAEVTGHRWDAGVADERSTDRWSAARGLAARVEAEQVARSRVPDQAVPDRHGLPSWSGVSGAMSDRLTPQVSRDQLTGAAEWIGDQMRRRGQAIATDPSAHPWARQLGPVPADSHQRRQWELVAGRVDSYRRLARVEDPERALPVPRGDRQRVEVHSLRAAMSDLRVASHRPAEPGTRAQIDQAQVTADRGREVRREFSERRAERVATLRRDPARASRARVALSSRDQKKQQQRRQDQQRAQTSRQPRQRRQTMAQKLQLSRDRDEPSR